MPRYGPEVYRAARDTFRFVLSAADAREDDGWPMQAVRFEAATSLAIGVAWPEAAEIDMARVLGATAAAAVVRVRERRAGA